MCETGRRSMVSTSEFGLYSDRSDRSHTNHYATILRKSVIVVMAVITAILVGIFLYDFASSVSNDSKINQETKHIFILQNVLKKSNNMPKKSTSTFNLTDSNGSDIHFIQDRSDGENIYFMDQIEGIRRPLQYDSKEQETEVENMSGEEERQDIEGKHHFKNHAMVNRVTQSFDYLNSEESDADKEELEFDGEEQEDREMKEIRENVFGYYQPVPFRIKLNLVSPMKYKNQKYQELSHGHPYSSGNIQDIINSFVSDENSLNHGLKFTGIYTRPKKYETYSETGENAFNGGRINYDESKSYPVALNNDPFVMYKPKQPSDVNLLASNNFRFAPSDFNRYNNFQKDYFFQRPLTSMNIKESSSDESEFHDRNHYATKQEPTFFNVMLDFNPQSDINQSKRTSKLKPQTISYRYNTKNPNEYNYKHQEMYVMGHQHRIPISSGTTQQVQYKQKSRNQMIVHINFYPRKKNEFNSLH